MNLFQKKRGMTPVLATITLIVLAVMLGAVAMSWGASDVAISAQEEVPITCLPYLQNACAQQGLEGVLGGALDKPSVGSANPSDR